jgi:hypothetical protein
VEREQGRHRREGGPDEDGAAVFPLDADRCEDDRRCCRERGGLTDGDEVDPAGNLDVLRAEQMDRGQRNRGQCRSEDESGQQTVSHRANIDRRW